MKQHYKAVILVLASSNDDIYIKFRQLYETYLNVTKDIKVFFVFGKQTSEILQVTDSDLVFDTEETYYPGMLSKTLLGIDYILNNYSFDYLVRTNLSTFWVFDNLIKRLDNLPKTNYATGPFRSCVYKGQKLPDYIAGTSLVMTRDAAISLVNDTAILINDVPEDYAMTQSLLAAGVRVARSVPRTVEVLELKTKLDPKNFANIVSTNPIVDHYRIKSASEFRYQDIDIFKYLLKHYYGKDLL